MGLLDLPAPETGSARPPLERCAVPTGWSASEPSRRSTAWGSWQRSPKRPWTQVRNRVRGRATVGLRVAALQGDGSPPRNAQWVCPASLPLSLPSR